MALIQGVRRNLGNGLLRADHLYPDGVCLIQRLQQHIIDGQVRVVLSHADFLGDNALLLTHALLCKIGHGYKGQQGAQIFRKPVGPLEVIPREG